MKIYIKSSNDSKKLKEYIYNGPVLRFNVVIEDQENLSTKAPSLAKAVANLNDQLMRKYDCDSHGIYKVSPDERYYTELPITPDISEEEYDKKPICEICGRPLTDGGYCPVCDIGEEDS